MKKALVLIAVLALLCVGATVNASGLLVDRGLPTANLNNAAGANRSNVAWVDGGYTPDNYWLVGDTFTNTSTQAWSINTIRLWATNPIATASLWGGIDGLTIGVVSGSGVITSATYADGSTYQGYSGAYRDMYQLDFAVDITLAPNQTYDFFLDGTGGQYTVPFVHASNAALSGSSQDGADNLMLWGNIVNGSFVPDGSWTSLGNGWDKASDVNVQVIGQVPEPGTLILLGSGLLGLVVAGRKKFRK